MPFENAAFLFDPNLKQIGIATDEYCYVHNLLSGTEDFRSASSDSSLAQTPKVTEDYNTIKIFAQS